MKKNFIMMAILALVALIPSQTFAQNVYVSNKSFNGKNYTLIENKSFNVDYKGITEIRVSQTVLDVNIISSNDNVAKTDIYFKKVYVNDPEYRINVHKNGSVLEISQTPKNGLSFTNSDGYINITAPKDVKVVSVSAVSGDISLKNLNLNKAEVSSISGDVKVYDTNISYASLKTTSGDIDMVNADLGNMYIASISGDLEAKNVKTEIFTLKTTSGDIEIGTIESNKIDVSTISGDVKIEKSSTPMVKAKTTSGNVTAFLSNVKETSFSSISGDITIYLSGDLKKNSYHFSSLSGEIEIDGYARARKSFDINNENAITDITAKTTSGDVYVKKGN